MVYKEREYPLFSACGLNCGLCSRFYTDGASRCPGCAGEGFSEVHPPCGILSCCQRKGLEYCYDCNEFPCKKYDSWGDSDSFITHRNFLADMEKARDFGIEAYKDELNAKVRILEELLDSYNDGRRKGFYCLAVNLLDLADVEGVMERVRAEVGSLEGGSLGIDSQVALKEKAAIAVRLFGAKADEKGIVLKLRK